MYTTTDPGILVQHKESCIECGGETSQTPIPETDEVYVCDDCEVTVADDGGQSVVRGDVSERVERQFSLSEVAF